MRNVLPALALSLALCTVISGPSGAQGISETGAVYGAASSLGAGVHHSNAAASSSGSYDAITSTVNQASKAAGSASHSHKGKKATVSEDEDAPPDPHKIASDSANQSNKLYMRAQQKMKAGNLLAAQKLFRQSVYYRERIWGTADPAVPKIYNFLGQIDLKLNKPVEAELNFRHALKAALKRYTLGSYELVENFELLAEALNEQKKYQEAANYYNQVYQLRARRFGDDDNGALKSAVQAAIAWDKAEDLPDAEDLLRKCAKVAEKNPVVEKQVLIRVLDAFVTILRHQKKNLEAEKVLAHLQELQASAPPNTAARSESSSASSSKASGDGKPTADTNKASTAAREQGAEATGKNQTPAGKAKDAKEDVKESKETGKDGSKNPK